MLDASCYLHNAQQSVAVAASLPKRRTCRQLQSMPVPNRDTFAAFPTFVKCFEDIVWQRTFLEINHVLLHVLDGACPNNYSIAMLTPKLTVVIHPAKRAFCFAHTVFLCHWTKKIKGVEVLITINLSVQCFGTVRLEILTASTSSYTSSPAIDLDQSVHRARCLDRHPPGGIAMSDIRLQEGCRHRRPCRNDEDKRKALPPQYGEEHCIPLGTQLARSSCLRDITRTSC